MPRVSRAARWVRIVSMSERARCASGTSGRFDVRDDAQHTATHLTALERSAPSPRWAGRQRGDTPAPPPPRARGGAAGMGLTLLTMRWSEFRAGRSRGYDMIELTRRGWKSALPISRSSRATSLRRTSTPSAAITAIYGSLRIIGIRPFRDDI